ncbi:hypothetical protein OIE71_15060 [Streptomyces sp. NBC_01725]|uniref:hypothetical protein n=1 Tax=Streptomyces sp. NBC_01725 TaxID=2975923 RepID=UPI002E27F22E|nr:hypothetical protein [Streptomyces sp. NBC_01725]
MAVDRYLRKALEFWEQGRRYEDEDRLLLASRSYTRGLGSFLSYVKLARTPEPAPAYYAFGALAGEHARLLAGAGARGAVDSARMALAASHLADPSRGQVPLIGRAVRDGRRLPLHQLTPGSRGPVLTPETRIAGAADARDLLASLLGTGTTRRGARELWPIGSGPQLGPGPVGYWKEKQRLTQAVLPSCAGLDEIGERRRLAMEADAIHAELGRVAPGFDAGRRPERDAR